MVEARLVIRTECETSAAIVAPPVDIPLIPGHVTNTHRIKGSSTRFGQSFVLLYVWLGKKKYADAST